MTTATPPHIEIREFGRPVRRLVLNRAIVVGRDRADESVADESVSRRHVRLVPSPTALSVVDLGSRNGTTVNGTALTGRAELTAGDVVRFGRSEIVVLHSPTLEHKHDEIRYDATQTGLKAVAPPPPPPPPATPPSGVARLAEWMLGIDPTGERQLFPAYTELSAKVAPSLWHAARVVSVAVYLTLIVTMFVRPAAGLFVLFHLIVPLLPITFFVAPGLWRNICPLAASNQAPRVFGFGRGRTVPGWLSKRGYLIAMTLFFGIAGARLAGLDRAGAAMGIVLAGAITAAFVGGFAFKGKSGWCSSICPLFPLQRLYGQTPFATVPNSHCQPCVGCSKNCYDFKPRAAYQADLAEEDRAWTAPRKLFASALPGFVLGFFILTGRSTTPTAEKYALLALFVFVAIGIFFVLDVITGLSTSMLTVGYAAMALNIFYWFAGPLLISALISAHVPLLHWLLSGAVAVLTVVWVARTRVSELQFAWTTGTRAQPVLLNMPKVPLATPAESGAGVRFETDGPTVSADIGMSVLDVAERGGVPIEAGCRMGVCGADPVAIVDGMSCLTPAEQDELNTLQRLGLGKSTRMACCARLKEGSVTVSLTPEPGDGSGASTRHYDRSIVSVVVIGNGIAGVTAADFIRRGHPDCEIHLVGQESHALYNRMGISRLVHGRSAMQGLYLLPERWYDDHGVTAWLNTVARRIDLRSRTVLLGTGDAVPYDRLILAMGASAATPAIAGIERPGSFVLRQAADAMGIRKYAQDRKCRRAIVAGGGLLGLEAAWSLHLLGLRVTVLERGQRLLSRQIDPRCSELVADHFAKSGIEIVRRAETAEVLGSPHVSQAMLKDGRRLPCDLFLAAVGIQPNADLARRSGVPVGKGVLVDDRMRTRVPGVYAAGDIAEHAGKVYGLWPVATEQGQAAAVNALGGDMVVGTETPPTLLKGVDLELFSIGPATPSDGDEVVVCETPGVQSYRRLVLSGGRVVGATVLGHHPSDLAAAQKAVRNGVAVDAAAMASVRRGDWSVLSAERPQSPLSPR
jgi:nitrite reductase (NADH) large subunit